MDNEKFFQKLDQLICIDPIQGAKLGAFLEKKLSGFDSTRFKEHLDNCEKCAKIIFAHEILNKIEVKEETAIAAG